MAKFPHLFIHFDNVSSDIVASMINIPLTGIVTSMKSFAYISKSWTTSIKRATEQGGMKGRIINHQTYKFPGYILRFTALSVLNYYTI